MSGLWALWCNLVRRVLFISQESIAGGATPKYTTRPRVLRGTGKGSFMETGGEGERKEETREKQWKEIEWTQIGEKWEGKKHK